MAIFDYGIDEFLVERVRARLADPNDREDMIALLEQEVGKYGAKADASGAAGSERGGGTWPQAERGDRGGREASPGAGEPGEQGP